MVLSIGNGNNLKVQRKRGGERRFHPCWPQELAAAEGQKTLDWGLQQWAPKLLDLLMESLGDMSESSIAYQAFKVTSVAEK